MKHKIFLILVLILPFCNLYSQSNNIEIYNEMFKWKFSIPSYFENVSPIEAEKHQASGKELIENKTGQEVVNKSIKIYGFKSENYNQLIVNYQPTESNENYSERFKEVAEILYESFRKKLPNAEITYSLSTEIISDIKFEVFDMKISSNNIKMNITAIRKSKIKSALESRIFDFAKQIILYGTLQAKQKYQKTSY